MAKIALYKIEENGERTEKKLDESKVAMLPELIKRGWKRVGIIPEAPAAAPAAPAAAATPKAPAAPAEEGGGFMDEVLSAADPMRALGAFARGAAPVAGGAVLGGMMAAPTGIGIPAGMAAGAGAAALTQLVADPAMGLINWATDSNLPMPSKALEDMLTELGVPEPKTAAERLVQQATAGVYGAAGMAGLAGSMAAPAGTPAGAETFAQRVAAQAAKQPGTQAFAGGTAGLAGQAAAEEDVGPTGQFLASLAGGAAGGGAAGARTARPVPTPALFEPPVPLAPRSGVRDWVTGKIEEFGKEADLARVKTAGPQAVELAKATGGPGANEAARIKETARVMRELDLGGLKSPKSIAKRSESAVKDTNALINRIVADVDQQGADLLQQIDDARASLDPAKVKAAEDAARNADEIEASVAAAERRLLDEKREVFSASTSSGVRPPAKGIKEPGVTRVNDADLQRRAKEAADDAAAKVAAAKDALKAAQKQEKLTTKGSFAPDPLTGEVALAPSGRDPLMFKAALLQNDADMAVARANQLAEEARLGAASAEEPMGMREVVSANKTLQGRQRELDMMRAAAKKAREDAVKAADDAGVSAVNARAERLLAEAGQRKVSSKAVAERIRAEMADILRKGSPNTLDPEQIKSETARKQYAYLEDAAQRIESEGDTTLRQAYDILSGIEGDANFGRPDTAKKTARAETAKEQSRAFRREMEAAAGRALPAGSESPLLSSPYARIGRGAPVEGPISGEEALGSFRRVGSVARSLEKSSAAQLADIAETTKPSKIPIAGTDVPFTKAMKTALRKRNPLVGLEATLREEAQAMGQSMREPTIEDMALQQGIPASFLEALRQIDEEAAQ